MVNLAHLSDVHLNPMPRVHPRDLLSKRITGYINWKLNRRRHMHRDALSPLVEHMKAHKPDITAISGDLVNLSLDAEFEQAAEWLRSVGPAEKVCAIPGNHDVYVQGGCEKFCKALGDYATGETMDNAPFPYVRRIGDVAVIGCSSAIATPPFFASGAFEEAQAKRLSQCLEWLGKAEFFRVVMIHHPPNAEWADDRLRGMRGASRFRRAIAAAGAELILHGHMHRSLINELDGPGGAQIPVVGVAAGSADAGSGEDPARYNLFSIERTGTRWSCMLHEYGYQRIGDDIVLRLKMRIH